MQVSDARPNAWFETGRICSREPARIRVSEWLEPHFDVHPELVVKDPRLSWFLGLWRVAAIRTGATPVFATMLRPPAEVVGSQAEVLRQQARLGPPRRQLGQHAAPHRARHPPAEGDGGRVFVRYEDLLTDWVKTTTAWATPSTSRRSSTPAATRSARSTASSTPTCAGSPPTLDDLGLPQRLHELTGQTWEELNKLADAGRRHRRGARRPSTSSARPTSTSTRRPRRSAGRPPCTPASQARRARWPRRRAAGPARWPTGSRTTYAPRSRRPYAAGCARRSGRERDDQR